MKLKVNGVEGTPFRGYGSPVMVALNGVKTERWTETELSGVSLSIANTYNDTAYIEVLGNSEQEQTEDSPSPDFPSPILSAGDFDLISTNGEKENKTHIYHTLRSLPNGVYDELIIDNANRKTTLIKKIQRYIFNGQEAFAINQGSSSQKPDEFRFVYSLPADKRPRKDSTEILARSTHFKGVSGDDTWFKRIVNSVSTYSYWALAFYADNTVFPDVNTFKAWLASQYNAGTPVIVDYELETPDLIKLPYTPIPTYWGYTNIYTNAEIQPTLNGKFRIKGGI